MDSAGFHLVRAGLDRRRLFDLARTRRLPARDVDLGYLVHCTLKGLFGELAPQPFSVDDRHAELTLLGYSAEPAEPLMEHARAFADPLLWSTITGGIVVSKPMPEAFPADRRLGFAVRVCPVVRKSAAGDHHRKGAEVDAFLSRCWEAGDGVPVDREAVYREWLGERLATGGAARLVSARMIGFQRERAVRSTHLEKPRVRTIERPDARFAGELIVDDSSAFQKLLIRGIGRHRAFGFGMLLLRPPSR